MCACAVRSHPAPPVVSLQSAGRRRSRQAAGPGQPTPPLVRHTRCRLAGAAAVPHAQRPGRRLSRGGSGCEPRGWRGPLGTRLLRCCCSCWGAAAPAPLRLLRRGPAGTGRTGRGIAGGRGRLPAPQGTWGPAPRKCAQSAAAPAPRPAASRRSSAAMGGQVARVVRRCSSSLWAEAHA